MPDTNSDSGSPAPALNKQGLLERVMGDEELAVELVQDFLQATPAQIRSLNQSIAAADAAGAGRRAHFIKGAAAAVGAEAMWEVAAELEKAGKNGDLVALERRASALEVELGRLSEALKKEG